MLKKKKQNWNFFYTLILAAGALAIGFALVIINNAREQKDEAQSKVQKIIAEKPAVCEKIRRIDGLCLMSENEPIVFSIMIDNHRAAMPPAGLSQASLVYEAIAEAPITRLLAVFYAEPAVEKIGHVRSARPYFVDWAAEFGGPYVHVGGSDEALDYLDSKNVFDLNEFSSGQYFWRNFFKKAPHNVFTSTNRIEQAIKDKNWKITGDFASWKFQPEKPADKKSLAQVVKVDFSDADYAVEWRYDRESNEYVRYIGGEIERDTEGKEIRAKNIVVMRTESKIIDSYGRLKTRTVGIGKSVVYQGNKEIEGEWLRPNLNERTRFYAADGEEIAFFPGTTWIEVVAK